MEAKEGATQLNPRTHTLGPRSSPRSQITGIYCLMLGRLPRTVSLGKPITE